MNKINRLLIICGPTVSGKTSLGLKLARLFSGEIISADSRQVYKGMDIITGKDLSASSKAKHGFYDFDGIKVWGLDLVKPNQEFSAAHWLNFSHKIIKSIWQRKKLPMIVGGTGFWIKMLLDPGDSIGIPPDWELRKELSDWSIDKLSNYLKKLDKKRWEEMNQSDRNNPRRLIRAIELASFSHKPNKPTQTNYDSLIIGLKAPKKFLYQRIDQRVKQRFKQGAEKEVKDLLRKGYSWDLASMTGIGYQEWREYFEGFKTKDEIIQAWKYSEHAYTRRQLTFFKKLLRQAQDKSRWFNIKKKNWQQEVVKLVETWYIGNNGRGKN